MKQKVLVLGATGMVGHVIALYLQERGYRVIGCSRRKSQCIENICLDILNFDDLKKVILNNRVDVVINCVGILNTTCDANVGNTILINSYLPHFLDKISHECDGLKIIHISTDCVFSGNGGPYYENSIADGITLYDRTKALGEIRGSKNLTFRNSVIGPDINVDGIGLFNWFMKQSGVIYGYKRAFWTGVSSITLAKAMEAAIEQNLTGLYHLVNNEVISKYDLLNAFKVVFPNSVDIKENIEICTKKILINTRQDFQFVVPSYHDMVLELKDWINCHKHLYPHYIKGERL